LTTEAEKEASPSAILRQVLGLQAQLLSAATLGLRARGTRVRSQDVSRALVQDRSIVRTWLMRGTLHLVAADDFGWLQGLLGPIFAAGNRARLTQLGLDPELKQRGVAVLRRVLSNGPLTRYQIVDRLRHAGINLDAKSQAPIHLIQQAAFQGVLCLGPDQDGEPAYVLVDDWIGQVRPRPLDAALGEMARRYFTAYGPATVEDLVTWSGLPVGQARRALEVGRHGLQEVKVRGQSAFVPTNRLAGWRRRSAAAPAVRLLPAFDTYLLAYRSRDLAVPAALQRRLQRGGGWLHPAVLVDGRAIGAWTLARAARQARIVIEPYERLNDQMRSGIEGEVADIGRFLDLPISSRIGEPASLPAPRRSSGQ
jgi:hypothetical protein